MSKRSNDPRPVELPYSIPTPIRAAIVGTGYIADATQSRESGNEGVELVGVCDANPRSAQAFAANWSVPATFDSLESMLNKQQLDCVHVLTPPDRHYSLAKTALQSGVHVFIEKPMCTSVEEADELLALARDNGLCLGVNQNFLYTSAYQRLREVVISGGLGALDYVAFNHF